MLAYTLAALIVFALVYKRLEDAHERRRLRLVFFGAGATFSALLLYFWLLASGSPVARLIFSSKATDLVFLLLWSIFPAAFAHAVLHTGRRPASAIANSG